MAAVHSFATADADTRTLVGIRRLLDVGFEGTFTDEDWDHTLGGRHAVAMEGESILAHAAVVERTLEVGGRPFRTGYVEAVATDPGSRRRGLGRLVMATVTDLVREGFELGALSTDVHAFYESLGWERWRGPTFVRDGEQLVRTQEEDDGIMVLRFGPSEHVDLDARIVCDARSGDVW